MRTIWSEWTRAWWSPWVAFGALVTQLSFLSDYLNNHLIWVDLIQIVLLGFHVHKFSLEFPLRLYDVICSCILYIVHILLLWWLNILRHYFINSVELCIILFHSSFLIQLLFNCCSIIVWLLFVYVRLLFVILILESIPGISILFWENFTSCEVTRNKKTLPVIIKYSFVIIIIHHETRLFPS